MKSRRWLLLMTFCYWMPAWPPTAGFSEPLQQPDFLRAARFIAYTPRSFSVISGQVTPATKDGIRADLLLLKPWFDGIVTYSTANGLEHIPRIAREMGFREVLLGIWDPTSEAELQRAFAEISRPDSIVTGLIVGNEGLYAGRYSPDRLLNVQARIRTRFPRLPLSTSEPFFLLLQESHRACFASQSFLAPNIHPMFEPWFRPDLSKEGVDMVQSILRQLQALYPAKTVLIHETGMPSGPAHLGHTPENQMQFWKLLSERLRSASEIHPVYFEAFDTPWKPSVMAETFPGNHSSEAFWGFWDIRGNAKPVLQMFKPHNP